MQSQGENNPPHQAGLSNPRQIDSNFSDPYIDIFDSDRIKAIVDQKLEQAMFEKVFFLEIIIIAT
jgi:hypothetical protein